MIAHTILLLFIGGLIGYVTAAIMMVAGDTDRERERQEKETEKPPVICEEQKLVPITARVMILKDTVTELESRELDEYVTYKLMSIVENAVKRNMYVVEHDYRTGAIIYGVDLWVERKQQHDMSL